MESRLRAGLLLVGVVAGTVLVACAQSRQEKLSSKTTAKIIPWIEVNIFDARRMDNAVAGLKIWARITDTVIVSTEPRGGALYGRLHSQVPKLHIIPGLKTSPILSRAGFDSPKGWARISKLVRAMCETCETKRIVLENESAIRSYIQGESSIDFPRLREGLRLLPKDIEIIWYPAAAGTGEKLDRYVKLLKAVEGSCKVRFVELCYSGGPRFFQSRGAARLKARVDGVKSRSTLPLVYLDDKGKYWTSREVADALPHFERLWGPEAQVIVYPGEKNWVGAAQSLVGQLPGVSATGDQ